jgi:hypothetical protein
MRLDYFIPTKSRLILHITAAIISLFQIFAWNECVGNRVMSQRLGAPLFEKHRGLPLPFWIVLVAKEGDVGRDPPIMMGSTKLG